MTTEKVIDIINNLLSSNCDEEQEKAFKYIKCFLNEYQPIEDFTSNHIISTKAICNALPLLNSYYQCIPDNDWTQLKGIMFNDENMKVPKKYPFNRCRLSSLFHRLLYLYDHKVFDKNVNNDIRPKIRIKNSENRIIDLTSCFFMDEKSILFDLLTLSRIWNDLYFGSDNATESEKYFYQFEIAERLVGRRLAADFCELMKWLSDYSDAMNDVQD